MRTRTLSRHAWLPFEGRRRTPTAVVQFVLNRFLLLPLGAALAVVWANVAGESYFTFAHRLSFAVNEIGMAFFFGLLTQEVVEAMMPHGALHTWRRWSLAVLAAAGGLAGSALVFLAWVQWDYQPLLDAAWPVATAIDVAAAYYLLKIIAPRSGLLPFVLLLGIVTNVFGAVVVAMQHSAGGPPMSGAALLLLAIGVAAVLRQQRVRAFWPYLAVAGPLSWLAFYIEGIHPALSLVPIVAFLPHEPRGLDLFANPPEDDETHHYEHEWNTFVQLVLFLFGLVNAGVLIRSYDAGTWAVLTGAIVGRPLGILLAVAIGLAVGLHLPARIGWRQLLVAALATSSGFTFALFFATGLYAVGPTLMSIKFGALLTALGAFAALGAARALHVGIFRRTPAR